MVDDLIKVKKTALMLDVSAPLVYKMAERGQLPCVRWKCPGKGTEKPREMLRFKRSDIVEFIEQHYKK